MPRFIFSDTRDELIQKRNAWKMKYDARKQLYDDQDRNYDKARWAWVDNLTSIVTKQFQSYIDKLPGLRINADRGWGDVQIRFEYEPRRDDVSLQWSYRIDLDERGNIEKQTNSWSGFKAVTSEQIDDLINSANFLKAVVDFDWEPLLKEAQRTQPKYSQYMGIKNPDWDPEYKDPGYDRMIREADIEEAISSGEWIKGIGDYRTDVWYFIKSQTPKYYNVVKIRESDLKRTGPDSQYYPEFAERIRNPRDVSSYWVEKIKKDNISFASPLVTKTPEELLKLAGTGA